MKMEEGQEENTRWEQRPVERESSLGNGNYEEKENGPIAFSVTSFHQLITLL